jgi:hypothetical protein
MQNWWLAVVDEVIIIIRFGATIWLCLSDYHGFMQWSHPGVTEKLRIGHIGRRYYLLVLLYKMLSRVERIITSTGSPDWPC